MKQLTDEEWRARLDARAVRDPSPQGHRARLHRRLLGRACDRGVSLRGMWCRALPLRGEVRLGYGLAELRRACGARERRHRGRLELRNDPDRGHVRIVRRASRPRLRRRARAEREALLHQLVRARSRAIVLSRSRVASCCRSAPCEEMFSARAARRALNRYRKKGLDALERDMLDERVGRRDRRSEGPRDRRRHRSDSGRAPRSRCDERRGRRARGGLRAVRGGARSRERVSRSARRFASRMSSRARLAWSPPTSSCSIGSSVARRTAFSSPGSPRGSRTQTLALSFPRDRLLIRFGLRGMNAVMRVMRRSFRVFVHPRAALVGAAEAEGLALASHGRQLRVGVRRAPASTVGVTQMPEIGLFPLPVVLLPTEQAPLHIFEERYKELIEECLAEDKPFGLVYADGDGIREIGTEAVVLEVLARFDDGRMNIVVEGRDAVSGGRAHEWQELSDLLHVHGGRRRGSRRRRDDRQRARAVRAPARAHGERGRVPRGVARALVRTCCASRARVGREARASRGDVGAPAARTSLRAPRRSGLDRRAQPARGGARGDERQSRPRLAGFRRGRAERVGGPRGRGYDASMAVTTTPAVDARRVRADFPIFEQTFHGKPLAFLDSAASSQKPRQMLAAMNTFYETSYANVHRGVYELAERATEALELAREKVRALHQRARGARDHLRPERDRGHQPGCVRVGAREPRPGGSRGRLRARAPLELRPVAVHRESDRCRVPR